MIHSTETEDPELRGRFSAAFAEHIERVEGWLSFDEAFLLYRLAIQARNGPIVEIGAYRGRSTVALVLGSQAGASLPVISVDPHADFVGVMGGRYGPSDRCAFYQTALATGIWKLSQLVALPSADAARAIDGPISLLWIDGDHSKAGVLQDVRLWVPKLDVCGVLVLDDIAGPAEGPFLAYQQLLAEGWRPGPGTTGKVAVLLPPVDSPTPRLPHVWTFGGVMRRRPGDLVSASRFDLGAKHLYARLRLAGARSGWGREVYLRHIFLWDGYFEEVPPKRNAEDYLRAFDDLLDATAASTSSGLDTLIPVTLEGHLLSGAHRLVAALLFDRPARTIALEIRPEQACYDGRFFEELARTAPRDGDQAVFAAMAQEYARIGRRCRLVILFPAACQSQRAAELVAAGGAVVWQHRGAIDPSLQAAFIRLLYEGEPWLGSAEDGYRGAVHKAERCFASGDSVHVLLLECRDLSGLVSLKASIRAEFDVGNHSAHISDSTADTVRILASVADADVLALHALCERQRMPNFDRLFERFRRLAISDGREDELVVTGSAVLALLGLRDCADLDYLHHGLPLATDDAGIASHNDYAHFFSAPVDDLIFDPRLHFTYRGIKFVRPDVLASFKRARGEAKDLADVALLRTASFRGGLPAAGHADRPLLLVLDDGCSGRASFLADLLALRSDVARVGVAPDGNVAATQGHWVASSWDEALAVRPQFLAGLSSSKASAVKGAARLAGLLGQRSRDRVLVVRDELDDQGLPLLLGSLLEPSQFLCMGWQEINGYRREFLAGVEGYAWLPRDAAWTERALAIWDDAEPRVMPA